MFISVTRVAFENEATAYDNRELLNLTKKLKTKFPISIRMGAEKHEQDRVIYFTYIHENPKKIHSLIDNIVDFCEDSDSVA